MPKLSPNAATQTMIDNLPEKTGQTLEQWLKNLDKQKFEKHGEIVKWLKSKRSIRVPRMGSGQSTTKLLRLFLDLETT